jgi:hypothetical protein
MTRASLSARLTPNYYLKKENNTQSWSYLSGKISQKLTVGIQLLLIAAVNEDVMKVQNLSK